MTGPAPTGSVSWGTDPAGGHGGRASTSSPGLDLPRLTRYLRETSPERFAGPLSGRLIAGGRSNLTYELSDGAGRWALRRPPLGHVLQTAHDMSREYHVMSGLGSTDIPVPETIHLCTDASILGAPFYVMSFVEGTVYRHGEQLAATEPDAAGTLADELVDVLCRLHAVEPAEVGLGELGRPEGFLGRQVVRWGKQLVASRSRDIPGLSELGERLAASVPTSRRTALVHGDYKLDNVVVDTDGATIVSVLDWEMATLGDPLTDLVNLTLWWDGVRDVDGEAFAPVPADLPSFPASFRLIERYSATTGADLESLGWYLGLACYKLASIFEGMYFRATQGLTLGEGFDRLAGLSPALALQGHEALATAGDW